MSTEKFLEIVPSIDVEAFRLALEDLHNGIASVFRLPPLIVTDPPYRSTADDIYPALRRSQHLIGHAVDVILQPHQKRLFERMIRRILNPRVRHPGAWRRRKTKSRGWRKHLRRLKASRS